MSTAPRTDAKLSAARLAAQYSWGTDHAKAWRDVALEMRDYAAILEAELNEMKSVVQHLSERESILVDAMSEIKATIEGKSQQHAVALTRFIEKQKGA